MLGRIIGVGGWNIGRNNIGRIVDIATFKIEVICSLAWTTWFLLSLLLLMVEVTVSEATCGFGGGPFSSVEGGGGGEGVRETEKEYREEEGMLSLLTLSFIDRTWRCFASSPISEGGTSQKCASPRVRMSVLSRRFTKKWHITCVHIDTAFAATKQHAKLTPLIAPPTMTTYHHHGAGFYLQSVLFFTNILRRLLPVCLHPRARQSPRRSPRPHLTSPTSPSVSPPPSRAHITQTQTSMAPTGLSMASRMHRVYCSILATWRVPGGVWIWELQRRSST